VRLILENPIGCLKGHMAAGASITNGEIFSPVLFSDELQFHNNDTVNRQNMQGVHC
jgi:hypothetical protein